MVFYIHLYTLTFMVVLLNSLFTYNLLLFFEATFSQEKNLHCNETKYSFIDRRIVSFQFSCEVYHTTVYDCSVKILQNSKCYFKYFEYFEFFCLDKLPN